MSQETEKRELAVVAMSDSESQPGSYALILEDLETHRRIPVLISSFEALSIAIAMERITPARPLPYDLMQQLLEQLGGTLKEVLIHTLSDALFFARLIVQKPDGGLVEIESRVSDAIALAVRIQAPIFAYRHVIEEAGILSDIFLAKYKKGSLAAYSIDELEDLLKKVLAKEDYESAVRIRDLIDRRKNR